ncbi:MAG: glycosyltransferase family 2 protein [Thermoplasmata archaeon]
MAFDLLAVGLVFLILGIGSGLFALISLADGISFFHRISAALKVDGAFQPKAVVLIPVRGLETTLAETLSALLHQQYTAYRLIFITDPDDEADRYFRDLHFEEPVTVVRSKPLDGCSGKIAALLSGLEHIHPDDEVIAFADSDIIPGPDWLARLAAPLRDPDIAASTGYGWYFPTIGGLGPALQSAWNSAAGNVMFSGRWAYLWGGSYAIRREVLEDLKIEEAWRRSLSDDMVMTQALKEAGYSIAFAPRATVANYTDSSFSEVIHWTNRQACLALLYAPAMRRLALPYGIYAASLFLGLLATGLLLLSPAFLLPALLLLSPLYLGLLKNLLRRWAFKRAMPSFRREFSRFRGWFYLATVLLPFLMMYNVRKARRIREFEWRGNVYRFSSPEHITVRRG